MKTTMTFILFAMMTSVVMADWNNGNGNGNNNGNGNGNGKGARCEAQGTLDKLNKERTVGSAEVPMNPTKELDQCEKLKIIAIINGDEGGYDTSDNTPTMDGKASCRKDGGYTIDYKDCVTVKNLYNAAVLAETGMFAAQKIIQNEKNIKQQKDIAEATAKGDIQYGTIDAVIERNKFNATMNKTQAMTYSTAVTALSAGMIAWKGKKFLSKYCSKKLDPKITAKVAKDMGFANFDSAQCSAMAENNKGSPVFMNDDAKVRFIAELGILIQKAAEAMRRAGIDEAVAAKFENQPKPSGGEGSIDLDPCFSANPPAECKRPGPPRNISAGNFAGSTTDFGSGSGANQDFNFDPDGTSGTGADAAVTGANGEKIADMNSPFEKQAKEASGILNPAGAANVTPGGAAPSGGAGGGPGGGGGGSATIGDDLAGADGDDNKDPDIKTNKASGKYKAGGGGFKSVTNSGTEENPFASMFDAKGEEGGIEEDRSIASDDGEASGIFQKISRKYGQVQEEKRLDTQNVE